MPGKSPTLYDIKKTTIWFAIASIILVVCWIAMIYQDSHRDWKHWQREFMAYNKEKAQKELEVAEKKLNAKSLEALNQKLEQAKAALAEQKDTVKDLEDKLVTLTVQHTIANTDYQNLKQFQASDLYFFEEHRLHHEDEKAAEYEAKLNEREGQIHAKKLDVERLEGERDGVQAQLDELNAGVLEAEKEISRVREDVSKLETKIQKNTFDLRDMILNAPMLDFMNPTLRIQQAVVQNLYEDFYYVKVPRVDRCTTCHLAIDQKGYEDAPQPFTTHPNLDLFLSADSPHSLEEFGCTTCHAGSGHSVNFTTVAHTPNDEEQEKEWKDKYHWHEMHHWPDKMLQAKYVEASCAKCHTGEVEVPQADKLNEGRALAKKYGCFNCHKVKGFENVWEVGPSLQYTQSKLSEDWIVRWLHNPKEFRESTKMPRMFHLSNNQDEASKEKEDASIAGIAAYLMKNSGTIPLEKLPVEGNVENGGKLIAEVGCTGCHAIGEMNANDHGPELSGLGSKVTPEWLYTWLKNPHLYHADSRMPNMRLTDQEAADITAYLLQDKNEKFDSIRLPLIKQEVVDGLVLNFMTSQMRFEDAEKKLAEMSEQDRLLYLGEKMVNRQGCYGCHDIQGFDHAQKVGAELSEHGSKEVAKLDFGFTKIPHTRQDWFFQKLKEPRIFDHGKEKAYLDRSKMPNFDFTDEEVEALTTFLLSLQKVEIPLQMQNVLSETEQELEEGRFLAEKFNCVGCHSVDGKEGRIREITDDEGMMPPVLHGEGEKVHEAWLYHFLDKPVTIRPWLKYRMPTFGFTDEELTTFVKYFQHLSGVETSFTAHEIPETTPEMIENGREIFTKLQCIKCHQANPPAGLSASFLAPNLVMARDRLKPDWIDKWLEDPQVLQEGTMMPTFFYEGQSPLADIYDGDAKKQIQAMRDYMLIFDEEEAERITNPKPAAGAA